MVAASDVTGELTPDRLVLDAVRKWQPNLTDKRRLFAPFTTTLAEIRLAIEPDTDRPARTALSALAWHERAFVARFAAVRVRVADGATQRVRYMGNPHAR